MLTASGPVPSDAGAAAWLEIYRYNKVALDTYLSAAYAVGLLDGESGKELCARLASPDDANFRSAKSECMAAWFLAGKLRLEVKPRPTGRPGHPLEFGLEADGIEIHAEVKAPRRDVSNDVWSGDDSDLLQRAVESANKQFRHGVANLLVITPELRIDVFSLRGQLTRAFFGEQMIEIPIKKGEGGPAGPTSLAFKPSGHFLKHYRDSGQSDATPRFTRISAVLCIEEIRVDDRIDHHAVVVHNPYAEISISEDPWGDLPQFVVRGKEMKWTDGRNPHI
jgi:hypothetical protein